jgi:hypothetical protein
MGQKCIADAPPKAADFTAPAAQRLDLGATGEFKIEGKVR